jgi:transcriptional regulator with XRE-family HTH domain
MPNITQEIEMVEKSHFMNTLSLVVSGMRKRLGLKQTELAEMSGISQSNISRLEKGITDSANLDTLYGISEAFGLKLSEFIGFIEEIAVEVGNIKTAHMGRQSTPQTQLTAAKNIEALFLRHELPVGQKTVFSVLGSNKSATLNPPG